MKRTIITSYARTAIGTFLGSLKEVPVEALGAIAIQGAMRRSGLGNDQVDEVIMGHALPSGEAANIGRVCLLLAGLSETTPGFTVCRMCGSGIQAIVSAMHEIQTENAEIVIAGGTENLSRVPYYLPLSVRYQGFRNLNSELLCANQRHSETAQPPSMYPGLNMGLTGENVAERCQISRQDQDLFSLESHRKATAAIRSGRLAEEIVPVEITQRKGPAVTVQVDEHPRQDTSLEALARLRPAFKKDGTLTAGNSSGVNDGAAALVVMSEGKGQELGLRPLAYVVNYAVTALDPRIMGLGPVSAIQKLLKKAGLQLQDIDLFEINEAFAGQILGCLKELGMYMGTPLYERVNVNGGAVALGHPVGMTGARLTGTLAYELRRRNLRYGIASACIGGGMGIALLIENSN
ncbi:MAG TPA: thiolase family protein [Anaerolineae bacterium]|nr:thiolase family protein [Anaerolineae bacterium]HPL27645.1 thiolase family protein [Anaerolineae bacterium]